ncbi:MAG: hypothetical protein HQK61_00675 [Desulfamplus sp.]|nr:hypothetical protein [Desulfamplus sp.]
MRKKNKKSFAGKRKYFKKNSDANRDTVEDRIFDDDFTKSRLELDNDSFESTSDEYTNCNKGMNLDQDSDDYLYKKSGTSKDEEYRAISEDDHDEERELFEDEDYQEKPEKRKFLEKRDSENGESFEDHFYSRKKSNEFNRINQAESMGQSLLFIASALFLIGLALPVLLIFYLNNPPLDQHFLIFGISYFKLLFMFFISSAILFYASFFFLKSSQVVVIPVFLLALFCCFPFIAGLRNDLTVMQAVLDLKLFSRWPFFLKPAYLFFEFLLPLGFLIYLFLQLKSILGRKKQSYAYLCIALYLGIASLIGLSILTRSGQTNIISLAAPHLEAMGLFNINATGIFDLNATTEVSSAINQPETLSQNKTVNQPEIANQHETSNQHDFVNQPETAGRPSNEYTASALTIQSDGSFPAIEPSPAQTTEQPAQRTTLTPAETIAAQSTTAPPEPEETTKNLPATSPDGDNNHLAEKELEQQIDEVRFRSGHLLALISKIEQRLEERYQKMGNSGDHNKKNLAKDDLMNKSSSAGSIKNPEESLISEKPAISEEPVISEEAAINEEGNSDLIKLKSVLTKTANIDTKQIDIADIENELKEISAKLELIWQAIAQVKAADQKSGLNNHNSTTDQKKVVVKP